MPCVRRSAALLPPWYQLQPVFQRFVDLWQGRGELEFAIKG